jgi:hypothetical protein
MIVFDLRCDPKGHVFKAWFGSTGDYQSQRDRGLVSCPLCGSGEVEKAVMAPRVGAKGNSRSGAAPQGQEVMLAAPEGVKQMLAAMAAVQKQLTERSTYVGDRFADEARAIHLGESETRSIYGKATFAEAESLAEEGIGVMHLPFPVPEPGQEN